MLQNPNMNNPMAGQNHMGKLWLKLFYDYCASSTYIQCSIQISGSMLVNEMGGGNVGPGGAMMQVPGNQPGIMHQNMNTMNVQPVRVFLSYFNSLIF